MIDRWGIEVAGAPASVTAWDDAWQQFLHFHGDPIAALAEPNASDEGFAMGPVFVALYTVLAGSRLDAGDVAALAATARRRAGTERELEHTAALDLLVAGELTAAGDRWATIARELGDFAAVRFAHDVFLHVGDAERRVAASGDALAAWEGRDGWGFVAGQHAFSLNEVGRHGEAERIGLAALDADPRDLWARHALAHVYEETDDTPAELALLRDTVDVWADQDLLANHVWWHLALRLLAAGDAGAALAIHDRQMPTATTAFRLCDQTSILWRAELAGVDVGDRWDELADRWDGVVERHTCGFLDLHAALTFVRRPGHPGARRWFDGLAARPPGASELDEIFDEVVKPLVGAFRSRAAGETAAFHAALDALDGATARIGGSNAQRALIPLTREAAT